MGYVDELRKRKEQEAGVASKQQRTPLPPRTLTPVPGLKDKVTEKPKSVSPPPVQGPQKPTSADLKAAQPKPPEPIKPINKQEKTQQIRYDRHKEQAAKTGMQIKPVEERQQADRASSYLFNADGTRKLGKDASNIEIRAWLNTIEDEKLRTQYTQEYEADLLDPKSHRFSPYDFSGSNNLDAVARLGQTSFDRSFFTPENDQKYLSILEYSTPGGSPLGATKKGTRSTKEYGDALAYFYLKKYDLPRTEQAQEELSSLNRAIALRASQGGTADEIFKDLVDSEDFADNYKMLGEMRDAEKSYTWKLTTAAVPVSDDSIKATISAALRGEDISAVRDYTADEVNQLNATMTGTVNRNRIEMQRERFAARDARMGRTRQTLEEAVQEGPKGYGLDLGGADERQDVLVAGEPWTPPTPPTQQSWDEQHDVIQAGSDGYTQAPPEAVEIPNATEPPSAATMPLPNSVEPARAADAQTPAMGMARADEADARAVAAMAPAQRTPWQDEIRDVSTIEQDNLTRMEVLNQQKADLTAQLGVVESQIEQQLAYTGAADPALEARRDEIITQMQQSDADLQSTSDAAQHLSAAAEVVHGYGKQFAENPAELNDTIDQVIAGKMTGDQLWEAAHKKFAANLERGGTARINFELASPEWQAAAIKAKQEDIAEKLDAVDALETLFDDPEFIAGLDTLRPAELPEGVTSWEEIGLTGPPQNPGLYGPEHLRLSEEYENDPVVRAAVNIWLLFGQPKTKEGVQNVRTILSAYAELEQSAFGLGDLIMDSETNGQWTTVGGIGNDGIGLMEAVGSGVQAGLYRWAGKFPQLAFMLSSGMDEFRAWREGKTDVEFSQMTDALRRAVKQNERLTSAEMQYVYDNGTQLEVAATATVSEATRMLLNIGEGRVLGTLAAAQRWGQADRLIRGLQTLPSSAGIMGSSFVERYEQDGSWLKSFAYAGLMAGIEQGTESLPLDRFQKAIFGDKFKDISIAGLNTGIQTWGVAFGDWVIDTAINSQAEGAQEILSGLGGAMLDQLMYGDGEYSMQEAASDYVGAVQVSLLLGVAALPNMFRSAAYLDQLRRSNQQITNDQWHTLAVLYAGDKLGPNAVKAFEAAGQFSDNIDRERAILQVMGENISQLDKAEDVKAAQQAADRATAAVDAIDTKIQQEQGRQSEAEDLIRSIKSKVAAGEITALESLPEFERLREIAQDAKGNQINFMTQRRDAQALAQQAEEGLKTSRLASLDELRSMAAGIVDQEIEKAQSLVADIAAWTDQLVKSGQGMAAESLQASNVAQQDSEYSDVRKIGLPKGEQKRVSILDRLAQNIRDAAAELNATHFKDWIWQKADALKGLAEYDALQQRAQADAELDAQLGGEMDAAAQIEAADIGVGATPEIDYSDRGEAGADTPIPTRSRAVGEIFDEARVRTNAAFEAAGEQTDAAITESEQTVEASAVQSAPEPDVETQPAEIAPPPAEDPQTTPTTFNSLHSEAAISRVDDFVPSATARQQGVRRTSQTVKGLYDALGIRSTQRYQPKNMRKGDILGEYNIQSGVVVTRSAQAIQPHAHEIGHAIFDRAGVFEADNMTPRAEYRADFDRMRNNLPADFVQRYTDKGQATALYHEAGAEFMARYLTHRDLAVAFAGESFVNRFESNILSKDQLAAMNKARDEFRAQMDADGLDQNRAMNTSHRNQPKNRSRWSAAVTAIADKYHVFLDFDAEARKQGLDNSNPAARVYTKLSNLGYSSDRANSIVLDALRTPDGRVIGGSMADILSGINYRDELDFNTYLLLMHDVDRQNEVAKRAADKAKTAAEHKAAQKALNAANRAFDADPTAENKEAQRKAQADEQAARKAAENAASRPEGAPIFPGQTAEESARRARTLESLHPEFRDTQKKLMAWWRNFTQAWLVDTNALPDADKRIGIANQMYPNYVPTFRSFIDSQDEFAAVTGLDRGGALAQAAPTLKRVKGGDQAIYKPVENMVLRVQSIVAATEKVLAMRQLHETVQNTPGQLGEFVRKVEFTPDITNQVQDTDLLRVIDAAGQEHYYQIMDPVMYNALMVPPKERGALMNAMGAVAHTFKSLTTMNNIFFAISNTMRDFKESYQKGTSWTLIDHATDFIWALGEVFASNLGEYFSEFGGPLANLGDKLTTPTLASYNAQGGGDTSIAPEGAKGVRAMERALYSNYFRDTFAKVFAENVSGVDRARGLFDGIRTSLSKLNDAILMINNTVETAQRYAEFRRQRGLGTANTITRALGGDVNIADPDVAFRASMDVTTDFRRSGNGDAMSLLGNIFMFMNAGIQGTYNVYRMAREGQYDKGKMTAYLTKSAVMHTVIPLLLHALISRDEDDKEAYDLVADNIKRDNWLIPAHYLGGQHGMFVKIPNEKGLPAAIGESLSAAFIEAYDKEGGDWNSFWNVTGRQIAESVNPYGSPLYAGVLEIMMNQTWWGGPVESEWQRQQNLSPVNRVKDSTSAVAVWLANKLEDGMQLFGGNSPLSPSQIDYFIDQSFGIVGDLTLSEIGEKILGVMQGSANMGDVVNATGSEFYRMISSRVLMDPTSSTDVNDQMYEMRNLVTGIVADVDLNGTSPRLFGIPPEQHKQIAKQLEQQNKKGGVLYQAVKNTSKYWDEIAAVKASKLGKEDQDKQIQAIKTRMALENIAATRYVEEILKRAKAN